MGILENIEAVIKKKRTKKAKSSKMVFYKHGETSELDDFGSGYDDERRRVVRMTPEQFLRSTHYQQYRHHAKPMKFKDYKKEVAEIIPGRTEKAVPLVEELTTKLKRKDVKVDTPFLILRDGIPVRHEGRHRAIAAEKAGMKKIPVLLVYNEKDEESDSIYGYRDLSKKIHKHEDHLKKLRKDFKRDHPW